MKALLPLLLVIVLVGCGNVHDPRISQSALPNAGVQTVSGFINAIQFSTVGPNTPVTIVTFIPQTPQAGPSAVISFCGDQQTAFVLNTFAMVNFTQGASCSNLVSVNM